jgi:hypothetical protein
MGEAMECSTSRQWIFRKLDGELSSAENGRLDLHLAGCPACAREWKLRAFPQRLGRELPVFELSPFFYGRLRARLREEEQGVSLWSILLGLSRQVIPALAAITLALLSLFAYLQMREPQTAAIMAYDRIFTAGDRAQRMLIADQNDLTDENILLSISDSEHAANSGRK